MAHYTSDRFHLEPLHALMTRRARELGKTISGLAADAGLARTYLYKLAAGATCDPSVRTLVRLAQAMKVSPVLLLRHFGVLEMVPKRFGRVGFDIPARSLIYEGDAVEFIADVTIPDHAAVHKGEAFRKIWEIQNAGRIPWVGRRVVRADHQYVIARRRSDGQLIPLVPSHLRSIQDEIPIRATMPGQTVQIELDFVAPPENCSVASVWRIHDRSGNPCFDQAFFLQVIVTVIGE